MDTIFIRDLTLKPLIGAFDWERHGPQTVQLDVEMSADTRAAGISDDLNKTVDYYTVAQRLREFASTSQFQLLESLAEALASIIIGEFNVPAVKLTLTKPTALRHAAGVGITIERHKING